LEPFDHPRVVVDAPAFAPVDTVSGSRRGSEIVTGAKRRAGAAEDHAVHRTVVVGVPQRVFEFADELDRQSVALPRSVQRDASASSLNFVQEICVSGRVGHLTF